MEGSTKPPEQAARFFTGPMVRYRLSRTITGVRTRWGCPSGNAFTRTIVFRSNISIAPYLTWRFEFNHRAANGPYFSGSQGITPAGGNTGSQRFFVDGFVPDPSQKGESNYAGTAAEALAVAEFINRGSVQAFGSSPELGMNLLFLLLGCLAFLLWLGISMAEFPNRGIITVSQLLALAFLVAALLARRHRR